MTNDLPQGNQQSTEEPVKWDYTSREQTLFIGAAVVGLNFLIIILAILYRTIPAVHTFFSGKAL